MITIIRNEWDDHTTVTFAYPECGGLVQVEIRESADGRTADAYNLNIDKGSRGGVHGGILMDTCEEWCRREGLPSVNITVRKSSGGGLLDWWRRRGYTAYDGCDGEYWFMWKKL